ncbi:hypothetical protein Mesil_0280 [Allomeiothermus silvanus DSM 9946]|uniref:Uncharacterized protein n=1 Tax=Allomeiothermus silvanus (strain ATCC 700542 / DSM 9946 / NBRC 106475 / NCIMB 13440 / VI-R2) TaxID=526227 RepID=D7BHI4_ALLS1|nr:hypothetical protein [Allomeiothermus silvanus]ADH62222.1 hypothetical protein Mesil_0280 [Allomeiothermus silvanus DSM 9946]
MKRFTVTLNDELEQALEEYLSTQKPAPSLTALVQGALREYLLQAKLRKYQYHSPLRRTRKLLVLEVDLGGPDDLSLRHDLSDPTPEQAEQVAR